MTEVDDPLAGSGEVLFRDAVEAGTVGHDETGLAQDSKMPGGDVGVATDAFRNLDDHERFADAQFGQDAPAVDVGEGRNDGFQG